MSVCVTASEAEQIEILLPDGRKVIVIPLRSPGRSFNNIRIAFSAPNDIQIRRRPRKSIQENKDAMVEIVAQQDEDEIGGEG